MLLVDLIPKVGEKVVVCGGQPLSSRQSCLLLEDTSPAGGQINLIDPTSSSIKRAKKFQSGGHMPFCHHHTVAALLRSWITFLTPGSCTWITLLMPGSCTWVTHLTLGFGITHLDTFLTAGSNHSHISPGQWRQVDSSWRKPQPSGCSRGTFI